MPEPENEQKQSADAVIEERFTKDEADQHLFPQEPATITIGGRPIPVRPLNLDGVLAVYGCIKGLLRPLFAAYKKYRADQLEYARASASGDANAEEPFPYWYLDIVEPQIDSIYFAVTKILQRGDPTLTLDFVKQELEPLKDLQLLLPIIAESNALVSLVKKLVSSEMMAKVMKSNGTSPTPSDSPTSLPTSPGTTELSPTE